MTDQNANARTTTDGGAEATTAPAPRSSEQLARDRLVRAIHARSGAGALMAGLRRGFHPQLLLAWIIVLQLPALIAALPVATWLHAQFARSPYAEAIAAGRDPALLADALAALGPESALLAGSTLFALLLAAAFSPWLAGMVVAQIRTVYRLRMGGVLRAGLGEYPRMLRMLLWSLVPLGIAGALGLALVWLAQPREPLAQATLATPLAVGALGLLLMLAHVTVEAGRGWLGADLALRSVFEAWKRGVALLVRHPAATLVVYLGTSAVGYGLAFALGWLRMQVEASGWLGWLVALLLTQLVVAALAWGRSARLHGLADLATGIVIAQQRASADRSPEGLREAAQQQTEPAIS